MSSRMDGQAQVERRDELVDSEAFQLVSDILSNNNSDSPEKIKAIVLLSYATTGQSKAPYSESV